MEKDYSPYKIKSYILMVLANQISRKWRVFGRNLEGRHSTFLVNVVLYFFEEK